MANLLPLLYVLAGGGLVALGVKLGRVVIIHQGGGADSEAAPTATLPLADGERPSELGADVGALRMPAAPGEYVDATAARYR